MTQRITNKGLERNLSREAILKDGFGPLRDCKGYIGYDIMFDKYVIFHDLQARSPFDRREIIRDKSIILINISKTKSRYRSYQVSLK